MEQKKNKEEGLFSNLIKHMLEFEDVEEVLERDVKKLGNGARVSLPSKHIGKKTKVLIYRKKEEEEKKT